MKNAVFTIGFLVLIISSAFSQSETYKLFELDVGLNLANPLRNEFISEGNPIYLEPRFNISDRFSAGIRWEGTNLENTESGLQEKIEARLFTVDYYFPGKTRAFLGTGIGRYYFESSTEANKLSSFGLAPRIGVEIGHFRAGISYHILSGTENYSPDFVSVNIGLVLWGGKK